MEKRAITGLFVWEIVLTRNGMSLTVLHEECRFVHLWFEMALLPARYAVDFHLGCKWDMVSGVFDFRLNGSLKVCQNIQSC